MAALKPGFVKGQADNLPEIGSMAVFSFLGRNPDFMGAEIRGFKTVRSGRESYGDNAIGYVQVKRVGHICSVNAKVTPEHNVKKKAYNVDFECDESEGDIISVQCHDCAASSGGCKHAVALLMWLHRRSEEPSVTSTQSYWKKSNLSCVGSSLKFIKAKDLVRNDLPALTPPDRVFLNKTLQTCKTAEREDTVLTKYFKTESKFCDLSIHHLALMFFNQRTSTNKDADAFIKFCSSKMTDSLCSEGIKETVGQSESNLWHHMRFGRVTASRAHEASRCHTIDGSLVEAIVGATILKDTVFMERGRRLEKFVRKVIEEERNIKINLCGFATSPENPIMGASPDGITDNYVIEIKCPSSNKAIARYMKNNLISDKCNAQIQMQMHFFEKKNGLFCVAAPDFENSKKVNIMEVEYDEKKCLNIIENATRFWKAAVFPFLNNLNP